MSDEKPEETRPRAPKKPTVAEPEPTPAAFGEGKQLVYLGPSLVDHGLTFGTIFRGGLPANVLAMVEEFAPLKGMFAEPALIVKKRDALKEGGALSAQYVRVAQHFSKKEAK